MQDEGFILLWRRFFSHPYWRKRRKFSEAEAWIDMIASAAFVDHEELIGHKRVTVGRGEIVASVRYLEKRWCWSKDKVQRFLKAAVEAEEIAPKTSTPNGYTYTVVNYEAYQNPKYTFPVQTKYTIGTKIKKEKKEKASTDVEAYSNRAGEIWRNRMGGTAPRVRINVALRPLVVEHGAEEVLKWWDKYLTSSTAAQFKTPENFAQRFGAWRREHSNGASEDDVRRCLRLGGSMLSVSAGREVGFQKIQADDPELWSRIEPSHQRIDWGYLAGLSDFQLSRAIKSELEKR